MIILKRATYIQENSKQITKLSDQHNFNTRNKNKFITPRENEYVKQCLLCYNALPLKDLKIDDNTELQKFSKLITEFLVEKEFYAVRELVQTFIQSNSLEELSNLTIMHFSNFECQY